MVSKGSIEEVSWVYKEVQDLEKQRGEDGTGKNIVSKQGIRGRNVSSPSPRTDLTSGDSGFTLSD